MSEEQQMISALNAIKSSLDNLVRQGAMGVRSGGTTGSAGSGNAQDDVIIEQMEREQRINAKNMSSLNRALKNQLKASKALTQTALAREEVEAKTKEKLTELSKSVDPFAKVLDALTVEYNKLARHTLPAQRRAFSNLVKGTNLLSDSFSKTIRGSSLASAGLLKRGSDRGTLNADESSIEYSMFMDDLKNSVPMSSEAMKDLLRSASMLEQTTDEFGNVVDEFKDNINIEDFARLRALMGEASVRINEAFTGMEGVNVSDLLTGKSGFGQLLAKDGPTHELSSAITASAISLRQVGVSFGKEMDNLIDELVGGADNMQEIVAKLPTITDKLDDLTKSFSAAAPKMDKLAIQANTVTGKLERFITKGGWIDKLQELGSPQGLMGSVTALKAALFRVAKDVSSFNIAHVPSTFANAVDESVRAGMSLEDSTKFMQDNKRIMAMYGADTFSVMRGGMEDTFNRFGYTFAQGAATVAPMMEAAVASGINMRDSKLLGQYMDDTMKSFQRIAGVVNVSAEDFAKMNAELFNSPDVLGNMLGLTGKQADMYRRSLVQQREELTLRTGSLQVAQDILKAQVAQQRAPLLERFKQSGMLAARMQVLGYSGDDVMKATRIAQKGRRQTDDEKKWMTNLFANMNTLEESKVMNAKSESASMAIEAGLNMTELSGQLGAWKDSTRAISVNDKANAGMTDEQRALAENASKASPSIAALGEIANTVTSIFQNSLVAAGIAASATLVGLALNAGAAARMLGAIGGKSLLGGLLDKGKGAAGKMGGALGKVGTKAAGAMPKLAAGLGKLGGASLLKKIPGLGLLAGVGFGIKRATEGDFTGAGMEIASGAASTIPGLGTAASLGIDGALMARDLGAFKTPAISAPDQLTTANPVNTPAIKKPSEEDVIKVSDEAAKQQLVLMAGYLEQMLQVMTTASKNSSTDSLTGNRFRRDLTSVPSFLAGRVN